MSAWTHHCIAMPPVFAGTFLQIFSRCHQWRAKTRKWLKWPDGCWFWTWLKIMPETFDEWSCNVIIRELLAESEIPHDLTLEVRVNCSNAGDSRTDLTLTRWLWWFSKDILQEWLDVRLVNLHRKSRLAGRTVQEDWMPLSQEGWHNLAYVTCSNPVGQTS